MKLLSTLDRYVLASWVRIFVLTALGFPIVSILINLTDTLNRLLDRGLTMREIAWSYVYSIPENMFLVMPAAVLFATVFTVGAMGRHSELTAAKAGGQSFHRLMLPVFVAAVLASGLAFAHPDALQLRVPRRSRLGVHHPLARRGQPPAQAGPVRARGLRAGIPGPGDHGRQRQLGRLLARLAGAERGQPGDRRAR